MLPGAPDRGPGEKVRMGGQPGAGKRGGGCGRGGSEAAQQASARLPCVNTRTAWIVYILLRLLFLAVPFAALMLIGWPWWLSLAVATLVGVSLSVIFLTKQRSAASTSIYEWRHRDRTHDDIVEDEAVDSAIRHGEGEDSVAGDGDGAGSTGIGEGGEPDEDRPAR